IKAFGVPLNHDIELAWHRIDLRISLLRVRGLRSLDRVGKAFMGNNLTEADLGHREPLNRALYEWHVIQLVLTAKEFSSLRFPACRRGCSLERLPTALRDNGSGGDDGISQSVSEMQRRNETRVYSRPQRLRILRCGEMAARRTAEVFL